MADLIYTGQLIVIINLTEFVSKAIYSLKENIWQKTVAVVVFYETIIKKKMKSVVQRCLMEKINTHNMFDV